MPTATQSVKNDHSYINSSSGNSLHRMVGLECKLSCDVAVNHTLILPWAMLIYFNLENIFKCIISQNPENLDPAEGFCMYCLTDRVFGFAYEDRADC